LNNIEDLKTSKVLSAKYSGYLEKKIEK